MTQVMPNGEVAFRFYRPDADAVRIVGDFTNWTAAPIDMKPAGNGWWTADHRLSEGEYRFRYQADGRWFTDFASYGVEPVTEERKLTGWNSVLRIAAA